MAKRKKPTGQTSFDFDRADRPPKRGEEGNKVEAKAEAKPKTDAELPDSPSFVREQVDLFVVYRGGWVEKIEGVWDDDREELAKMYVDSHAIMWCKRGDFHWTKAKASVNEQVKIDKLIYKCKENDIPTLDGIEVGYQCECYWKFAIDYCKQDHPWESRDHEVATGQDGVKYNPKDKGILALEL